MLFLCKMLINNERIFKKKTFHHNGHNIEKITVFSLITQIRNNARTSVVGLSKKLNGLKLLVS